MHNFDRVSSGSNFRACLGSMDRREVRTAQFFVRKWQHLDLSSPSSSVKPLFIKMRYRNVGIGRDVLPLFDPIKSLPTMFGGEPRLLDRRLLLTALLFPPAKKLKTMETNCQPVFIWSRADFALMQSASSLKVAIAPFIRVACRCSSRRHPGSFSSIMSVCAFLPQTSFLPMGLLMPSARLL